MDERWTVVYDTSKGRPVVWNCPPFWGETSEVELARLSEVESLRQQLREAAEERGRLRSENDALQMKLDYAVAKLERYRAERS
jgi:hypothetical protein